MSFNHLASIWYHSEPLEVPYSPNQFLGWHFFAVSYSKPALGPSNRLKQQIKLQSTKRQYPLINYLVANARFLLLLLLICSCFEHSSGCGYFFFVRALALAKAIRVLELREMDTLKNVLEAYSVIITCAKKGVGKVNFGSCTVTKI